MRIRRGKQTLNAYALFYNLGKAYKFPAVHFLAVILALAAFEPGFLGRARRHCNDHFIVFFLNLISHQDTLGEKSLCFYKTFKAFVLDFKPGDNIFSCHAGHAIPNLFIDAFGGGLIKVLGYIDKPEGVNDPVVPEKKFNIFS